MVSDILHILVPLIHILNLVLWHEKQENWVADFYIWDDALLSCRSSPDVQGHRYKLQRNSAYSEMNFFEEGQVPVPMTYSPSMPFPSVRTLFVCVLHHFKILHHLLQPPGSQVVEVKGLTPTPTGDPPHPSLNREGASFPALPIRLRLMRRVSAIFLNFVPSCLCVSLNHSSRRVNGVRREI